MKIINNLLLIFLFSVLSFHLMAQTKDANAETRSLSSFKEIEVSGAIALYLTQGAESSVAISTKDKAYNELIITEVNNGKLKIYVNHKGKRQYSMQAKAYVTFTDLQALAVSGASKAVFVQPTVLKDLDINVSGASALEASSLTANQCHIDCSGASGITINVNSKEIECKISGASFIKIKGQAETLVLNASGASSFKGNDLECDTCAVAASGASSIEMHANKQLSVELHGASTLQYKGEANLSQVNVSGGSSFKKHS